MPLSTSSFFFEFLFLACHSCLLKAGTGKPSVTAIKRECLLETQPCSCSDGLLSDIWVHEITPWNSAFNVRRFLSSCSCFLWAVFRWLSFTRFLTLSPLSEWLYIPETVSQVSLISNLLRNNCSALTGALHSGISHFDLITECNVQMYKEADQRGKSFCVLFVHARSSRLPASSLILLRKGNVENSNENWSPACLFCSSLKLGL